MNITTILFEAARTPCGLLLQVSDQRRFYQQCVEARTKAGNIELAGLAFRPMADGVLADGNFVIVRQTPPARRPPRSLILPEGL